MEDQDSIFSISHLLYFAFFFVILLIPKYLRKRKIKKLKYEWWWIIKKATVSEVIERYYSWNEDRAWYYLYRLKAEDENGNFYISEGFKNAEHWWRSEEEMKKKYDWVVYDLADKDNAIKEINSNIQRLELELSNNPWFFKKIWLKKDIETMKKYIDIANEWPITPYLVVNWHKISVWDIVDIYVNPERPSQYYFDLDFTKEK